MKNMFSMSLFVFIKKPKVQNVKKIKTFKKIIF